ncbi:hypothetical protein F5X68DRAFT_163790 [Plectosphaerella plurivora]|uniref:AAA+ ATPase domain-containing protein n=1 Tax=Plectosphaerella plurivora TaxID=936078 RepID=A0A9P8VL63_9PEZI|nr:hypothetical protein F5X68DRAFT_163790 [Plectosphaerella plurivora]
MSSAEMTMAEENAATAESGTPGTTIPVPSNSCPVPDNSPRVRWCVNYRNVETGDLIYEAFGDEESDLDIQNSLPRGEPSFEIIKLLQTKQEKAESDSTTSSPKGPPAAIQQEPPVYSIRIHSEEIINALQSVVKYYPQVKLEESPLNLSYPYPILCHHYDELKEFAITCRDRDPSTACDLEKNAHGHISLLLKYLDDCIMPQVRAEQDRNRCGSYTWRWMWVGRRPGRTVFTVMREDEEWHASVIHDMSGGPWSGSNTWYIRSWTLKFDGEYLGRVMKHTENGSWAGESQLESDIMLLNMAGDDTEPTEPIAQEAIRLGKLYWKLAEGQCQWHAGKVVDFPQNEINGLVMVDPNTYLSSPDASVPTLMGRSDEVDWVTHCNCGVCQKRKETDTIWNGKRKGPPFFGYNKITPAMTKEFDHQLDWRHYLLCPQSIHAFFFRSRHWQEVHLKNLEDPKFERDMIEFLEMEPKQLGRLKALATAYCRKDKNGKKIDRQSWSADFVQGKGKGLTFLLHGKPGVGKTLTAECIAEFTESPLMILNTSDIGTDAVTVEGNLTKHFQQAKSWGAVLLIDEADIFMERRSTRNLERNALVAGFLRALEFYDGILFLTTNRVGAFDDAFISRIHVQLYYKDFTDEQRQKIWHNFAHKLTRERGDFIRLNLEAREYLSSSALRSLKWNGREIRNAFQTAVSLAEYDAKPYPGMEDTIQVTEDHFKAVIELSKDFKEYLDELHLKNEEGRAAARHERLDSFHGV